MLESRNSAIKLVQAHVDLANASKLARIAQDAAVIGNINSSEAFERLVNGISRGNVLILRNIGINVNLQSAYQQMAQELGKTAKELTENERVQARLNAVMERGTDIAGTYQASMDTAGKQILSMNRYVSDLKTTFGETFNEVLTIAVMGLTSGLKDANGEVSELAKNGQLQEWGHNLTMVFVGVANAIDNILNGAKAAGTWAAHFKASGDIDAQFQPKYANASNADKPKIYAQWQAALTQEQQQYVAAQATISEQYDRIQRAGDERMATILAKKKKDADERLKVDQDYAAAASAILMKSAGGNAAAQEAARKQVVDLYNKTYVGTPTYRDTEGRDLKPKVDQADAARLQNKLARIQEESAIDKSYAEFSMKLDDMRHKAGEMGDEQYFLNRKEGMATIYLSEQKMYADELAALRAHHNSTDAEREKNQKAIDDILGKQGAAQTKYSNDTFLADEAERLRQKAVEMASQEASNKYISGLNAEAEKLEQANGAHEKSRSAIERETVARIDNAIVLQQQLVAQQDATNTSQKEIDQGKLVLKFLEDMRDARARIATAAGTQESDLFSKRAADQAIQDWQHAGASIADSLSTAFGAGGKAIGEMFKAYSEGVSGQLRAQKDLAAAKKLADDNPEKIDAINRAQLNGAQAQLKSYGDMAQAAQGFFDQGSRGYKAMAAASEVLRAAEIALSLVKGVNAVLTQGEGDPYTAFGRMAAMAAIVTGLGVAISGGGSGPSSADRQAANGTGTIAGDPKAKSDSIAKSLALVEKNTYNGLEVSMGMLSALRSIESSIGNFAGLLVQTGAINNPNVHLNTNNGLATTLGTAGLTAGGAALGGMAGAGLTAFTSLGAIGGPIGMAIGAAIGYTLGKIPVIGKLMTSIFGGKQTLDDQGFMMAPTTLAQVAAGGVNAKTYADVTTSGGWFRGDKHDTNSLDIGTEADRQIAQVITGIGDSIKAAGAVLGLSGAEFDAKLSGFVIDIGKISLKGLSTADQQAAIQAAFSKLSDQMTTAAVGSVGQWAKAGEGALETLTRIATDYQTVDVVFKSLGITCAEVGVSSIGAREKLIDLAGGLDKFTSQAEFFFKNFLTQGQQMAAMRAMIEPTLSKYGLSTVGADAVQQFAKVTLAFGSMGEAGAEAYTELMRIAPAFKTVTDVAKDLQDQINELVMTQTQKDAATRATLDPTNQLLFDQLQQAKAVSQAKADLAASYQTEAQGLQSAIDKLKSFSTALHSFVNSLQLGNLSPLNPADKYGAALTQFNATLAKAQAGDADAQSSLQSVAQSFLQASKDANASNSTYQSDYRRVVTATTVMADRASAQVTEGQANLAALREQIKQLTDLNGTALGMGDLISHTGLTIVEAINNLGIILAGGKNAQVNNSALTSLYQEVLGRAPDAPGMKFWSDALMNGTPFTHIVDEFRNSPEYLAKMGLQPTTTSVTPSTQYGAVLGPAAPVSDPASAITRMYEQILGREPDAAGLSFWADAAKNGTSLSHISDELNTSPEHMGLVPPPTVTLPPPNTAVASSSGQSAQVVAQLASLNTQVATLIANAQKQADNQVDATMTAGADTSTAVSQSVTIAARQARWDAQNEASLR
jgi:hypothetical protein